MFMMGDTLVALDWDLKNVHPLLAKSWTVSDDRLTYTFKLRDDVTFCSGKKFTADDVIYSFTRLADPSGKWPFYWRLGEIDSLTAPDPYTLVYKLKRPHSELLVDLANFAATIINKENVEALGADFGVKGFDGTGPLCWESWQPRKELVLKRHDAYKWGPTGVYANKGPVKYQKMIWRIVPEETTRIATMLSGQADFCHWNPLQAIETLKKAPNLAVYEPTADFAMYYWGLKSTRENMKDKRVRQALAHLVDRAVDGGVPTLLVLADQLTHRGGQAHLGEHLRVTHGLEHVGTTPEIEEHFHLIYSARKVMHPLLLRLLEKPQV